MTFRMVYAVSLWLVCFPSVTFVTALGCFGSLCSQVQVK
jgi:hypothetical protein